MKNVLKKLTSRKFLAAVAGIIVGIVVAYGGDTNTITEVAGLTTSIISIVSYMIVEGVVDAKAIKQVSTVAEKAIDVVKDIEAEEEE